MRNDGANVTEQTSQMRTRRTGPPGPRQAGRTQPLKLHRSARIRHDLVARVRAEIDAGTYLTETRINTAVARLFNELDPGGGRPEASQRVSRVG